MTTTIVLIGAGGHAASVTNVALSCGMSVVAYVDDNKAGGELMGIPVVNTEQCISDYSNHNLCIAIGDNAVRERVFDEYKRMLPNAKFPSLIHKSSVIGIASEIGEGTVVMPLSNIGPKSKVGRCCIVNTKASIDHDCIMNDFSSIGPGVVSGGTVTIGNRSAISIGAIVKHGLMVGDDVVIGANSYVNTSIDDNVVAYGTPCRIIRKRKKGDSYLR
jgi:sugar O-acyltransferase (sialic acid O-acetyltransferase NeuD family)